MEVGAHTCRNCGKSIKNQFCEYCGQRTSVDKVTFTETFHDLVDNLFSISAPLPRTIRDMAIRPGKMFRDYLAGKRKQYYKPISFFILATIIYLFFRWLIDFDIRGEVISTESAIEQMGQNNIIRARDYMFRNINNLLFFFVLSLSFMLKIFNRKSR